MTSNATTTPAPTATAIIGIVGEYDDTRGFGYIITAQGKKFLHISALKRAGLNAKDMENKGIEAKVHVGPGKKKGREEVLAISYIGNRTARISVADQLEGKSPKKQSRRRAPRVEKPLPAAGSCVSGYFIEVLESGSGFVRIVGAHGEECTPGTFKDVFVHVPSMPDDLIAKVGFEEGRDPTVFDLMIVTDRRGRLAGEIFQVNQDLEITFGDTKAA